MVVNRYVFVLVLVTPVCFYGNGGILIQFCSKLQLVTGGKGPTYVVLVIGRYESMVVVLFLHISVVTGGIRIDFLL